ncbi:MAG TPA: hypothetical protein VFW60_01070 [Rhodanobacteraceae bacterium]|nr:hypothetical protein [Rhodanobacteraceae bacterium]
MIDLLQMLALWALSPAGLALLFASVLLGVAAVWLSPARGLGRFLLVPLAFWAVFSTWIALDSSSVRSALAGALWGLVILGLFALALAPLVAKGKRPLTIVSISVALYVVQLPFSAFAALFIGCSVGHDCP